MMAFLFALIVAVVLATGIGFGLSNANESSAQAYSTSGTRLDRLEAVDQYGREPADVQKLHKS